jgi:hypothetical protein
VGETSVEIGIWGSGVLGIGGGSGGGTGSARYGAGGHRSCRGVSASGAVTRWQRDNVITAGERGDSKG